MNAISYECNYLWNRWKQKEWIKRAQNLIRKWYVTSTIGYKQVANGLQLPPPPPSLSSHTSHVILSLSLSLLISMRFHLCTLYTTDVLTISLIINHIDNVIKITLKMNEFCASRVNTSGEHFLYSHSKCSCVLLGLACENRHQLHIVVTRTYCVCLCVDDDMNECGLVDLHS